MNKPVFYHAGCTVCVSAEQELVGLIGADKVAVVHLGEDPSRLQKAKDAGVKSVPAMVMPDGQVLHINFGAAIGDL